MNHNISTIYPKSIKIDTLYSIPYCLLTKTGSYKHLPADEPTTAHLANDLNLSDGGTGRAKQQDKDSFLIPQAMTNCEPK